MFITFFLLLGAFFIISENNLKLAETGNLQKFLGLYYSWIIQLGGNSFNTAGYIVKLDWLPGNSTG